ncbi:MAG: hypothetical protein O7G88_16590 [bacterium]|nr:hypothetical protein [bacterium]
MFRFKRDATRLDDWAALSGEQDKQRHFYAASWPHDSTGGGRTGSRLSAA